MSELRTFDEFVQAMAAAETRMGGAAWRGVYEQLETADGVDNLTNLYAVYRAEQGGDDGGDWRDTGGDDGEYDWTSMY